MPIALDEQKLYRLIKKAVREVIKEEEFALFLARIPKVSDEEMKEICKIHGKPGKKNAAYSVTIKT